MTKIETPQEWLDRQYDEYKKHVFNEIDKLIEERQYKLNESYEESYKTLLVNILKSIENKYSYERIYEDILIVLNEMGKPVERPSKIPTKLPKFIPPERRRKKNNPKPTIEPEPLTTPNPEEPLTPGKVDIKVKQRNYVRN
jgi:hypothetical protein